MKKFPLSLKILLPVFIAIIGCGIFLEIKINKTHEQYLSAIERRNEIEAIPAAEVVTDLSVAKEDYELDAISVSGSIPEDVPTYQYNNTLFISYSDEWDENDLALLCEELLKNKHGDEIDYLDEVTVYGEADADAIGLHEDAQQMTEIPVSLYGMIPEGMVFNLPHDSSKVTLYNGDEYTTVEQMAITLSHEYGHHYTMYYFTVEGTEEAIQSDPYFLLRNIEGLNIEYYDEYYDDWDEYLENHMWYLVEIAADDYVYLMGSPNTRRQLTYLDAMDTLKLDVKGKDDELDAYYADFAETSFNESPHENIVLPLPDQVPGLAELFYSQIGLEVPEYIDRTQEAAEIEIKVSSRKKYEYTYYNITWDKPWDDEGVTYTLVAYDEEDNLIGAVKSISADESAVASIGSVVYETSRYYHYYKTEFWTKNGFLRFRVIATFSDGSAVVSPALDWNF